MDVSWQGKVTSYEDFVVYHCKYDTATQRRDALDLSALGLSGEAGEYTDLVKKELHHDVEAPRSAKLKELGDTLWYLQLGAHLAGFTLEEVAQANADKIEARYPTGFVPGGGIREGAGAA